MSPWKRCVSVSLAAIVALLGLSAAAVRAPASDTPGTPSQVASLVGQSAHVTRLPSAAVHQLEIGAMDDTYRLYPSTQACSGKLSGCAFGDTASQKVVVLFGDSHILMWLPAIVPAATKAKVKIVLIYSNSCPVALIGNFWMYPGSYGSLVGCEKFRNAAISVIHAMNPSAVIIGERTTLVYSEPSNVLFTALQWQLALETTILRLKTPTMKVAVMQDTNWFDLDPMTCLAANPNQVQKCDEPFPNPKNRGNPHAEFRAAKATGSAYIYTRRWLCTAVCSPVIGNTITNYDNGHLSATYASYLSIVVGNALRPFFQ
jgi:SGNH domain (fused to AT3 domains)